MATQPTLASVQENFRLTLEAFFEAAPAAARVTGLNDILQSFFYCGAGSAFIDVQHRAAAKVAEGAGAIVALTEAFEEVAKEIRDVSREHEARLLTQRAKAQAQAEDAAHG